MLHIKKYGQGFNARFVLLVGLLSCLYVPAASQFFNVSSCSTLSLPPGNNLQPTSSSPFALVQTPTDYTPGVPFEIVLYSPSGALFNAILIQAREFQEGTLTPISVGSFSIPAGGAYEYLICAGSPQGTIISTGVSERSFVVTSYTPAATSVGYIEIRIVVCVSFFTQYWELIFRLSNRLSPCAAPNPCANGGTCEANTNGGFTCRCPPDYTGDTCATMISCAANPCENGGTCFEIRNGGYTCLCRQDYAGLKCSARNVNVTNLVNGAFNLADYLPINDRELVFLFTMVPNDSIVDVYIGEDLGMFQIGNGDKIGVNPIIPGGEPIPVAGGEFWIQITASSMAVRPFQFRMLIYQFFIPFPPLFPFPSELPALLPDVVYYIIQEVPPGGIILLRGFNANIRYGIGRKFGVNDVLGGRIRLTPYDTYIWYCVIGPLPPTFRIEITDCTDRSTDPCENNPCINFNSSCKPSAAGCLNYICHRREASICAACCPNPCWNNGRCAYDSTAIKLFSCQCPLPFTGPTCHEGVVTELGRFEVFELKSIPLFIPVCNNFYIHFTVADRNSGVRILVLRGFIARFGLGPEAKKNPVINEAALVFNVFNEFWVCLIPNGAIAEFTLEIFPRVIF